MLFDLQQSLGGMRRIEQETTSWKVVPELRPQPAPGTRRPKSEGGAWPTIRRAWLTAISVPDATHAMVWNDDMSAVPDFWDGAKEAIATKPDSTISYFSMRRVAVTKARDKGLSWTASDTYTGGGCLVMPVEVARDWLRWDAAHMDQSYPHDDWRISMYHVKHGKLIWSTVPCLMEHAGAAQSMLGHGGDMRRTAAWLATSGKGIDWSLGADKPVTAKTGLSPYPDLVAAYRP